MGFSAPSLGNPLDPALLLTAFGVTFLAELPDKSALTVLLLATRRGRLPVFAGAAAAFLVHMSIAVAFGGLLSLLPVAAVRLGAGLVFVGFGLWMALKPAGMEEAGAGPAEDRPGFLRQAWTAFGLIFLAEWGDLTQFSTAALVAKFHRPATILAGAVAGMWAVTLLAVLAGHQTRKALKPGHLKWAGALAFLAVGAVLLLRP